MSCCCLLFWFFSVITAFQETQLWGTKHWIEMKLTRHDVNNFSKPLNFVWMFLLRELNSKLSVGEMFNFLKLWFHSIIFPLTQKTFVFHLNDFCSTVSTWIFECSGWFDCTREYDIKRYELVWAYWSSKIYGKKRLFFEEKLFRSILKCRKL